MEITLKQLEVFRAVVVAGSITRASRRISLSQPSISQQLAKLEDMLKTQLIFRNRTGVISLTPAGEFWFKTCDQMLRQLEQAISEHERRFVDSSIHLRLGAPPTLRGHFVAAAAQIASAEPGFTKFELVYALTSAELVEQMRVHQLNFAIVTEDVLADDRSSFAVAELFKEPMCWVVPKSVSIAEIHKALAPATQQRVADPKNPLYRSVEIAANVPMKAASDEWYRHHLPASTPMFSATTYAAAVDIVAEGLATTHAPSALLPNLPASVHDKLQVFRIPGLERSVVLAMQKHLMTLPGYANIFNRLVAFCRNEYAEHMIADRLIGPVVPVVGEDGDDKHSAAA